ncbi:MAG: glycosyltransferase family 47 protein [Desulfovibrio sp.]|jgi:hypothetical protein|nr:glycosyltransferase family 47 protein [Desulfovibrio sp.]
MSARNPSLFSDGSGYVGSGMRLSCYVYKEGRDFSLPPSLRQLKLHFSFLAVADEQGRPRPHPDVFVETDTPQKAFFFLFPFDIGAAVDFGMTEEMESVLGGLPWFSGRAERHLVSDMADRVQSVSLGVCLFKISVTRESGLHERAVIMNYPAAPHVLNQKPEIALERARYDCSFVGTLNHYSRRFAICSIRRQAPRLRFFVRAHDTMAVRDNSFFIKECSGDERLRLREVFVKSLRESISVLCPPGIGPQSGRLYETMCMARLPVLFDYNTLYPFHDYIDYSDFSLIIPAAELIHTGAILREWLARHDEKALYQKCALARKIWVRYFSPERNARLLLEEARHKFGL